MKLKSLAMAAMLATGFAAATGSAVAAEQFFPVLSGRTGPVAPNATPWANGHNDYMKLVNARGGINGVMTLVEECETAYATDKGVECYERLKGKHGGATVGADGFPTLSGEPGGYGPMINVYGRDGEMSPRARGPIAKARFGSGVTYYCEQTQI